MATLRTPSVLLVNASLAEREEYTNSLRRTYRVMAALDGLAAYHLATSSRPDLVIADVHIAGSIGGLELTRRLRNNRLMREVSIVVLTAASRPQDADLARKAGADLILEKPVSGSRLLAEVERLPSRAARSAAGDPSGPLDSVKVCPRCGGSMAYRDRQPILSTDATRTAARERLHYVSGWFCVTVGCGGCRL